MFSARAASDLERIQRCSAKEEVFAIVPEHGYRNLIGTTMVEDDRLEEWVLEAEWVLRGPLGGPTLGGGSESFGRYLYFVNDSLVDMSIEPLAYRDRQALIIEWRNR